jgi:hypothetical protein
LEGFTSEKNCGSVPDTSGGTKQLYAKKPAKSVNGFIEAIQTIQTVRTIQAYQKTVLAKNACVSPLNHLQERPWWFRSS